MKNLVREYYKLTDTCSTYKKKLSADLRIIFPNYNTVFSDSTSNTSLEILSNYPTPKSIIDASKEDVIKILIEKSKKGLAWSEKIYSKLISIAKEADINDFVKPKHLVAFFGIDSSVNQSGKFKGDQSKISKRGTRIGRRALYAVALASIRHNRNGIPINKVLLEYYQVNLKGKKAKVALVAIMHKIINYIFAVLRNQTPFEQRDPKVHRQMFLENEALHDVA